MKLRWFNLSCKENTKRQNFLVKFFFLLCIRVCNQNRHIDKYSHFEDIFPQGVAQAMTNDVCCDGEFIAISFKFKLNEVVSCTHISTLVPFNSHEMQLKQNRANFHSTMRRDKSQLRKFAWIISFDSCQRFVHSVVTFRITLWSATLHTLHMHTSRRGMTKRALSSEHTHTITRYKSDRTVYGSTLARTLFNSFFQKRQQSAFCSWGDWILLFIYLFFRGVFAIKEFLVLRSL